MPDDLDRHEDEVDDTLDDVESMFADLRDSTQDNVDDAIDEIERQRRILERMGEQDLVKALRDIERHYKTDYDEPSEARQAEDDIDAVVARHDGYPAPFSDVGLRRVEINGGWWTTRRKFVAGAAGLLGAGIVASDAGNYAEGDEPAKGGLQLPFGDGDIDAWGILENHGAAEGVPETPEYKVMEGEIPREVYTEIYPNILENDRRVAQEIMGPDTFDRYTDGKATEFAVMNVNYDPDPKADNSSIEIGLVQADEVDDLSDIPEEEISYGLAPVSDRAAQTLIQELEAYQKQEGY